MSEPTTAIAEYSATESALATLRERYALRVYDVTTAPGMREARGARAELRTLRTALEKMRVDLKAPVIERGKLLDTEAKRITAALVALERPIDEQIAAEELRRERDREEKARIERDRVERIRGYIETLRALGNPNPSDSADQIGAQIAAARALVIAPAEYAEFVDEAERVRLASVVNLQNAYRAKVVAEAEAQRIEAEKRELAEQRAADRKREAEERKRIAEEERAANERIAAAQKVLDEARAANVAMQAPVGVIAQAPVFTRIDDIAAVQMHVTEWDRESRKVSLGTINVTPEFAESLQRARNADADATIADIAGFAFSDLYDDGEMRAGVRLRLEAYWDAIDYLRSHKPADDAAQAELRG